jgi:multidrug efflux pump subunit AcrA (membrane-fusion protein)
MKETVRASKPTAALAMFVTLGLLAGFGIGCERHEETGDEHPHDHDAVAESVHDHDHEAEHEDHDADHEHDHPSAEQGRAVAIPPTVRQNLGITFVQVERRPVQSTIRLPGQFELRPAARREYHVMLAGRVELSVRQYQAVGKGDLLFTLDSPAWRRVQSELAEAYKTCYCCLPELDAAKAAKQENDAQIEFLEQRIAKLTEAEARDVNLEAELARLRMRTPRLEAEVRAKESDMQSAQLAYDVRLNEAASLTGVSKDVLEQRGQGGQDESLGTPRWATVNDIVIRAEADGIVDHIGVTQGGWAEAGALVLETIDPSMLRFHADALQTDINLFEDGQAAQVVPPPGGSIGLQDTVEGTITSGFQAHPNERTVPIYLVPEKLPGWARAGVTAYLEVFIDGDAEPVPAIPEAAVVRDGLQKILFRRDPHDPDQVFRIAVELGARDGRWVEVTHGVQPGDEVVLGGVYPLMLATSESGEIQKGGHMHADGTLHQGQDH